MTRARNLVVGAFAALTLFTGFDHAMRVDQASMCARGDAVICPDKLWWFAPAQIGPRLVGYGCEGASASRAGPSRSNNHDRTQDHSGG